MRGKKHSTFLKHKAEFNSEHHKTNSSHLTEAQQTNLLFITTHLLFITKVIANYQQLSFQQQSDKE